MKKENDDNQRQGESIKAKFNVNMKEKWLIELEIWSVMHVTLVAFQLEKNELVLLTRWIWDVGRSNIFSSLLFLWPYILIHAHPIDCIHAQSQIIYVYEGNISL